MAKRQRKPKAGHQKSKKKPRKATQTSGSTGGVKGTMTGLRGGFRGMVRGGGDKKKSGKLSRILDILLWIAVGVAAVYFITNMQCR